MTLGRGTNKKEAKRRAAAEMLSKLSGTRSNQGCNNLASRNGDGQLKFSKCYEKNCSTRNIESSFSPIREENYFSRPKEESYSKYVKQERMSFPKPNGNTTLNMNEIQPRNLATNGDSLSCSTEDRQPQEIDSRHESFPRKLSLNAQPFKPSFPSVSARSVITENVRLNPAADAEWTRGRGEARVRGLARPPAEAGQPRGLRRHQGGGEVRRQVSGWRP